MHGNASTQMQCRATVFEHFGHTAQSKQVLAWIEHGFQLRFVPIHSASQFVHPRYEENELLVTQLLQNIVSKEQVPALTCSHPSQGHFANWVSCQMHKDFVRETLQSLKVVGALPPWEVKDPLVVISGLGIVKNCKGKFLSHTRLQVS